MSRDDRVYLRHIIDAIARIDSYLSGMNLETFLAHHMAQDAIIRQFAIIGEAAKNLSDATRQQAPDLPWKAMAGMRDKLIHQYFGVDVHQVYKTAREDLPQIKSRILPILTAPGKTDHQPK